MKRRKLKFSAIWTGLISSALVLVPCATLQAAEVIVPPVNHIFSINDVQGGFNGFTYSDDPNILCGINGSPSCPVGVDEEGNALPQVRTGEKLPDTRTADLYPVNSEFGFIVSDFVGAAGKTAADTIDDGSGTQVISYTEGWVGNVEEASVHVGVAVSNADTDFFKVKPPMGTWCGGLGATSVKCSTEHYTVLEHVKTCFETIPYMFADEITGDQGKLIDPETGLPITGLPYDDCTIGKLDNVLYEVIDGVVSGVLLTPDENGRPNLPANESTVLNDIAVNTDYAITKKDDGKPLYRWGDLIKRPNDVRLYAKMALPSVWKDPGANYAVTAATLTVTHTITNNPNDQIRPEDMENEGATGKLPEHSEVGDTVWTSPKECYEGDGHYIPAGTVLKNPSFALDDADTDPYAYSADLLDAMTNAWYTTTDRDPFADGIGIGPRWRLLPNKFGQDIPGLEIPLAECSPVPFSSGNIRYETGEQATTVINLLDFADDASPLRYSSGWVNNAANFQNLCPEVGEDPPISGICDVSVNGSPMTDDFDLVLYIKGDKKPVVVYSATLDITYDDTAIANEKDLALDELIVPSTGDAGQPIEMRALISNIGTVASAGTLGVYGLQWDEGWTIVSAMEYYALPLLAPGSSTEIVVDRVVPDIPDGASVYWFATLSPLGGGDINLDDNWTYSITLVNNPPE